MTSPVCAVVRADLPGLDGHELSTRRATEVRTHLTECPDCTALAASFRSVRRTLSDLALVPTDPPDGLLESLLDRAGTPAPRERAAVVGRGVVSGARPAWVAASAGVGAVAAAGLGIAAWKLARRRATAEV